MGRPQFGYKWPQFGYPINSQTRNQQVFAKELTREITLWIHLIYFFTRKHLYFQSIFCIRKTAWFLSRLSYNSLQFLRFHFHTVPQFPNALYGKGRNATKLFSYIPYMVYNDCTFTTSCIPIPDALVNLLISQHPPFIDRQQIEDVKLFFCHANFVGIAVNFPALRMDFQAGNG